MGCYGLILFLCVYTSTSVGCKLPYFSCNYHCHRYRTHIFNCIVVLHTSASSYGERNVSMSAK